MVKATLQRAVLLGMTALGLLIASVPSYAEVQNVKVGGDVTVRSFWRRNLDLRHAENVATTLNRQDDLFLMSTVGLNVGADLTENVSAYIRLANERNWNQSDAGTGTANGNAGEFDLSQAYVTLKELFYSPLTVRIGQQPIQWGRGFVLGSNLLPTVLSSFDAGAATHPGGTRLGAISAPEYTDFTAFDAIRATLDLGGVASIGVPLTVDYVYIKMDENLVNENDDINLQGFNFSTRFDDMNSELEADWLNKRDRSAFTNDLGKPGSVNTIGIRGSSKPVEGSNFYGEMALQFGHKGSELDNIVNGTGSGAQGWAFDLGGDFTFADVPTSPKVGMEWILYSGHNKDNANQGWEPMAPSYFTTLLRSYQTRNTITGLYPTDQNLVTSAFTNQHELAFYGGLKPIDDLNVDSRLSWFWLEDGQVPDVNGTTGTGGNREGYVGSEWDTVFTYDYTDDVQLGLAYGVFFPGSVFHDSPDQSSGRDTAQELISKVSVKF